MDKSHHASPQIRSAIHQLIDRSFVSDEMRKRTHEYAFYHEKNDFPFGALAVLHHDMLQGESKSIDQIAAAVELIILSFDLLDDWQDQDNDRPPWMNDEGQALTIENGCLIMALSVLYRHLGKQSQSLQQLLQFISRSIQGQFSDLEDKPLNEDDYLRMIQQKSGSLTAVACLAGALCSGHLLPDDLDRIEHYAVAIGVNAQLQNDLDDVLHFDGKNDLLQRKHTLATMYLLDHPSENGKKLKRYYDHLLSKEQLLSEKASIEAWINASGVVFYTNAMKAMQQTRAEKYIDQLPIDAQNKQKIKKYLDQI
ncbi:polyprenyl synthetase family protein [Sporolactobacillus shoreicorticis]|nr:polyprenyl synthetase family protein [Sporolactobacillus shoreicorticis]MCO7128125.1 polyprenyl synthetase family protein [Sporolactobacillus shoreicorticis]